MKTSTVRIILLTLISGILLCACSQPPKETPKQADPVAQGKPQEITVEIKSYSFNPADVTIKKGDTVVWHNASETIHTVTSITGKMLDSGDLEPGKTFSFTFNEAGTFTYYCNHHVTMKGKVMVQ